MNMSKTWKKKKVDLKVWSGMSKKPAKNKSFFVFFRIHLPFVPSFFLGPTSSQRNSRDKDMCIFHLKMNLPKFSVERAKITFWNHSSSPQRWANKRVRLEWFEPLYEPEPRKTFLLVRRWVRHPIFIPQLK